MIFDEIERTEVEPSIIQGFTKDHEHGQVGFSLFREVTFCAMTLGSVMRAGDTSWSVREAIYGGHFVRLAKLMKAFLRQTKDSEAEIAWITARAITECVINVIYLLRHPADEVITSYLHQSLQHDRQLMETINANIAERGTALPIEERMLASVGRTFAKVQIDPAALPAKRIQNWAGMNLRQKAEKLDMQPIYQHVISGSSRVVHGSWADLAAHHLTMVEEGRFVPSFDERRVRPQLLFSLAVLGTTACKEYLTFLGADDLVDPLRWVEDLEARIRAADALHEKFIVQRSRRAV